MIRILSLFILGTAFAQSISQEQIESKVRNDLDLTLSKIIEGGQFSVQVSANVETRNERQIVEGEQITQASTRGSEIHVPPLPGFDPAPTSPEAPPSQTRQVFRNVEKPVLRSLLVTLILDRSLDDAVIKTVEEVSRSYLNSSYPNLSRLMIQRVQLRSTPSIANIYGFQNNFGWLAAVLLTALLLYVLWRWNQGRQLQTVTPGYRQVGPQDKKHLLSGARDKPMEDTRLTLPLPDHHGIEKPLAFSGVPANPQYADHRRQLLDAFLKNASIFRIYFQKLDAVARTEICTALRGPGFDTLLESLELENEEAVSSPPSEDQLQFFLKNFSEFQEALRWQDQQFFGFLPHLTEEQLAALVQSHSPVVGALILKFCKAETSAGALDRLNDQERSQIIEQFERTREILPEELRTIEKAVRNSIPLLPNFILGSVRQELEYWTRLLGATPDPQKLLGSLERARPDLYEKLARFRFQLPDIPTLPPPLIRKVIDEMENDELARALSHQSKDLRQYVLAELPEARRQLLESQILSYQTVDNSEVKTSVENMTRRFREVLV